MEPPKKPVLAGRDAKIGFILIAGLILAVVGGFVVVPLCVMSGLAINPLFTASAACEEALQPVYPSGANATLVDQGLITATPCGPPCWQGITPGETTYDETLAIIQASPLVKPGSVDTSGSSAILWTSALAPTSAQGNIVFQDGIAWKISYDLEYPLTVSQLIESLGEPEYAGLKPYRYPDAPPPPCDEATLVWMSRGVEVSLQDIDERKVTQGTSLIDPNATVLKAYLFSATQDFSGFIQTETSQFRQESLYQPWNGFDQIRPPQR